MSDPTVPFRLRELIDLEASVFRLGYKCAAHGNQSYTLVPPNDIFGMAISLGYMKLTWHQYTALSKVDTDATSFNEICAQFLDTFGTEMIRFVTVGGLAHLRIQITKPIAKWLGQNLFFVDNYYREEAIDIAANCYELMTDFQTLTSAHLSDSLTIDAIIKIGRIFRFLAYVRNTTLRRLKDAGDETAYFNSILVAYEENKLPDLLLAFGITPSQAKEFIDIFSWQSIRKHNFLDLQYKPIVQIKSVSLIAMSIFAYSNLIRNALLTQQKRPYSSGTFDAISERLKNALRKVSDEVALGVGYSFGGISGEIDCIAKINDSVYVFECKNTLYPCSAFEQRTTLDHFEKAAEQLDRIALLWKDAQFRIKLGARVGWTLDSAVLKTCIVSTTSLLSGAHLASHPVRQIHELANFIETGSGSVSFGQNQRTFKLWDGEFFSDLELNAYLSETDNPVYEKLWQAFTKREFTWKFEKVELKFNVYHLDQALHLKLLGLNDFVKEVESSIQAP